MRTRTDVANTVSEATTSTYALRGWTGGGGVGARGGGAHTRFQYAAETAGSDMFGTLFFSHGYMHHRCGCALFWHSPWCFCRPM